MEEGKKTKAQVILDAVCGIIMILAVIAYLIVGFTTNIWHPTWLILVCSALGCGIVGIISNTYASLKGVEKENKKDN